MTSKRIRRTAAALLVVGCCALAAPAPASAARFERGDRAVPASTIERGEGRGFLAQVWGYLMGVWAPSSAAIIA